MKEFLLLLLFVLPFQFAWGAAGAVCLHQSEPSSHFGHHYNVSKQDDSESRDDGSPIGEADDCQTCGSQSLNIVALSVSLPEAASVSGDFAHANLALSSPTPDRPERPDWHQAS